MGGPRLTIVQVDWMENSMETEYNLTLDDLADRLGMNPRHLTNKKNGPVTRVLETYFWLDLAEGQTYAENIVGLLEGYLSSCGKKGENIDYATWQRSIWELNDVEPSTLEISASDTSALALVSPSVVEIIEPGEEIASLGDTISSFNTALDEFDARWDAVGEQIGNRIVARMAASAKKSINKGLTELLENTSKIGGN